MKNKICILDLDGVLVDFVKGACKLIGVSEEAGNEWNFWERFGYSNSDFWEMCGYEFWANLDWMPDGKEILETCKDVFGRNNICIATSPVHTDGCVQGKLDWVKREIPDLSNRLWVGHGKHFLGDSSKWLIDDMHYNVKNFELYGGNTILVPRLWNGSKVKFNVPQLIRDTISNNEGV